MSKPLDTLWYTHSPVPTGLGIAVQSGRLAEAFLPFGTNIQSLRESTEREVREAHYDHHLQNSVRHGGNIPAIWAYASGVQTRVLGLSWSDEVQLILTTAESGVNSVRDLKNRRFGLPKWANVQIDFTRAQALRGLENALKLEGLEVSDVELVDYPYGGTFSDDKPQVLNGVSNFSGTHRRGHNAELVGLLRGEVDAIFLKGAHAVQLAHKFGLHTVIDTGSHPEPLIRYNDGTTRTLSVDQHLLDNHFDVAQQILASVVRAEEWAWAHPEDTRRFLAHETNSSEFWVTAAYCADAHHRLRTNLDDRSVRAVQDFTDFLARWHFIPGSFSVSDWIDPRPLEALRSSVATLAG